VHQLAVIDGAAAERGFGQPLRTAELGNLRQDLFVHGDPP
jgi:hypothetical protein